MHLIYLNIQMKDAAKALKWCAMAVDADPGNIDALCNRAEAHIMSEDYEEAVRDYEKAHEINKQDRKASFVFLRCICY
jgi:DnaJ family protein C protein 3